MYAHTPNLPQRSRLPVFDNPEGFENRLLFSSDVAFTFRCKRWATALHFNLFVRSTIQIPANSKTQNLGSTFPLAALGENVAASGEDWRLGRTLLHRQKLGVLGDAIVPGGKLIWKQFQNLLHWQYADIQRRVARRAFAASGAIANTAVSLTRLLRVFPFRYDQLEPRGNLHPLEFGWLARQSGRASLPHNRCPC